MTPRATPVDQLSRRWCIVVADDYRSDETPTCDGARGRVPVHLRTLEPGFTLLQRALLRALEIAPQDQVLLTADEYLRDYWEACCWHVRPAVRFIGADRTCARGTLVAAVLYVAQRSPSNVVTILPARAHVENEWILRRALIGAADRVTRTPEGVATLGMLDAEDSPDEDYFTVRLASDDIGFLIEGFARRPIPWVARALRRQAALVASGILFGNAGRLAAHLERQFPALTAMVRPPLQRQTVEYHVPQSPPSSVLSGVFSRITWHPRALPQRLFVVCRSGWSGLKSPQADDRLTARIAHASRLADGGPGVNGQSVTQRRGAPSRALRVRAHPVLWNGQ